MHVCVLSWVKWFTENDGLWDRTGFSSKDRVMLLAVARYFPSRDGSGLQSEKF